MDFSIVREGMEIEYIGDSFAYGGIYQVVTTESTYIDASKCLENEKGVLVIIEFMNDDTPMFIRIDSLNPNEWKLV